MSSSTNNNDDSLSKDDFNSSEKSIDNKQNRISSPLGWPWNPSLLLQNLPSFSNPFRRRGSKTPDDQKDKSIAKLLNGTIVRTAKSKELIELANFGVVEVDNREGGIGHDFKPFNLQNPTWCDSCGEFIWNPVVCDSRENSSNFAQYLQCNNCKYTCHLRCRTIVRIDCQGIVETPYVLKQLMRQPSPLFFEESDLRTKIEKYNEKRKSKGSGLGITLIDAPTQLFRGFLRVYLNLTRPINVVAGRRPPSIYDIINEDEANNGSIKRRTLTSFYMPRDTVKNIHITSNNTSLDVIKAMLRKFKVVDNPQKFALYLRSTDKTNLKVLKRIKDQEKPLCIQLEFDDDQDEKQIVLQENDTGDIAWDAFEVPELKNFIKILDLEEKEHLNHVISKYNTIKTLIKKIIENETSNHNAP